MSILYCAHLFTKYSFGISNFFEVICSLSHSIVFPLFICIFHLGRLSFCPSILWNSAFRWAYVSFIPLTFASLLFSSDNHFFLSFSWGMVLITASCTMLQMLDAEETSKIHQGILMNSKALISNKSCSMILCYAI